MEFFRTIGCVLLPWNWIIGWVTEKSRNLSQFRPISMEKAQSILETRIFLKIPTHWLLEFTEGLLVNIASVKKIDNAYKSST